MKLLFILSVTSALLLMSDVIFGQEQQGLGYGYVKVQYGSNRVQAEQILEDTRVKLQDMIQRRGSNPQTILLTGDMVRNWKTAQEAFNVGNYAETIRICNVIQRFIY